MSKASFSQNINTTLFKKCLINNNLNIINISSIKSWNIGIISSLLHLLLLITGEDDDGT